MRCRAAPPRWRIPPRSSGPERCRPHRSSPACRSASPLEHAAWIEHGGGQALWDELYAPFGVKPFMAGNTGTSMGGWFRKEILSLADLQGLKFRIPGLGGEMMRRLGANPTMVPPPEVLPALQSGAIDATPSSWGRGAIWRPGSTRRPPSTTGRGCTSPTAPARRSSVGGMGEAAAGSAGRGGERLPAEAAYAVAEAEWQDQAALDELVTARVELRRFPADVEAAARAGGGRGCWPGSTPKAGSTSGSTARSAAMQARAVSWSRHSSQAFLEARNGA